MPSITIAFKFQVNQKVIPSVSTRFSSSKTDRYIALGTLGIGFIFLGIFVLIMGLALTTYSEHFEQGIAGIVLSLVFLVASVFAILLSTRKIKLPSL
jgi:hypothetical protein